MISFPTAKIDHLTNMELIETYMSQDFELFQSESRHVLYVKDTFYLAALGVQTV